MKKIPITLGIVALLSTSTLASTSAQSLTWLGRLGGRYSTYAALIRPGWRLSIATAISSDGRYIVGVGESQPEGDLPREQEAFLLDTQCAAHDGDVNLDSCVDDADLLAVLFAFGNTGSNLGRVDVNCDGTVDDGDLLTVLFNFGTGC